MLVSINFKDIPPGPFRSRGYLIELVTPAILQDSLDYIEKEYTDRELLEAAVDFAQYALQETPSAEWGSLARLGFFPWSESTWEFDTALVNALSARYKSTYDHLRRALELPVVAAFFMSSQSTPADAREWFGSRSQTPFFSRAIKQLLRTHRWSYIASASDWPNSLQDLYWMLSDIVHVRGREGSHHQVQPSHTVVSGHHLLKYDREALKRNLDTFIAVVRQVAVVVVLTNLFSLLDYQ